MAKISHRSRDDSTHSLTSVIGELEELERAEGTIIQIEIFSYWEKFFSNFAIILAKFDLWLPHA
jgi:hypothetical protein